MCVPVWAVHEGMPSFNLHYESSYIAVQPIASLCNGLLTVDVYQEGHMVGDLAEQWMIADDGTRLVFHLRRGVTFHGLIVSFDEAGGSLLITSEERRRMSPRAASDLMCECS
jgi:hypothetical protein